MMLLLLGESSITSQSSFGASTSVTNSETSSIKSQLYTSASTSVTCSAVSSITNQPYVSASRSVIHAKFFSVTIQPSFLISTLAPPSQSASSGNHESDRNTDKDCNESVAPTAKKATEVRYISIVLT